MTPEHPQEWPLVSVNILAYNRRDLVRQTLQKTLGELDYPRDRLEVIVVDNESSDGTKEMLASEFPEVQVVVIEKNLGVPAWNQGFRAGHGDFFLVLDDDCFLTGDSLKRAVRGAQEQNADLVSFLVVNGYDHSLVFNHIINTGILEFWGCSALISRRAIERLGGFDPNIKFLAHELEFCVRFFDQGFTHLFLPEVRSFHMKKVAPPDPQVVDTLMRPLRRNWGYIVGKLFCPRAARLALFHMALKILLGALKRPRMITLLPDLLAGFRLGRAHYAPVRPEVSTAYCLHFIEFANPLAYAGLGHNRRRFLRSNRKFYPLKKAVLQLP